MAITFIIASLTVRKRSYDSTLFLIIVLPLSRNELTSGVLPALNSSTTHEIRNTAGIRTHIAACMVQYTAARATVHWQFTLAKAGTKLDRHYQKLRVV